ncbi:MAG: ribonuclease P protein component [Candidatus Berkelbacteria bacterium]
MLKKINRLSKDRDFSKVFKRARSFHGENLTLKIVSNTGRPSRFGFVVSNKINKRATRRNALKRRLRAIMIDQIKVLGNGFDAIVLVKRDYLYPYQTAIIKEELTKLLGLSSR